MGKYDALGKFGIGKGEDSDLFGLGEEDEDFDSFGLDEEDVDEDADSSDFSDEDEFDGEFESEEVDVYGRKIGSYLDDEFDEDDEFDDEFDEEFEYEFGESPREYMRDHGHDDYDVDDLRSELRDYYGTAMFGGMPMAMMDVERVSGESDDDVIEEAHRMGFL